MADDEEFDPDDYEGVSEKLAQLPRREVRRFEKDRKERDQLKAQLAQTEKLLAFAQAGVDATDPAAKWFIKGYDGDMDPEAIKAAAVEARVIMAGGTPVSDAERAGHTAVSAAANGAQATSLEDEIARQLKEVASRPWRDGDAAVKEVMKIVEANDIRLSVT